MLRYRWFRQMSCFLLRNKNVCKFQIDIWKNEGVVLDIHTDGQVYKRTWPNRLSVSCWSFIYPRCVQKIMEIFLISFFLMPCSTLSCIVKTQSFITKCQPKSSKLAVFKFKCMPNSPLDTFIMNSINNNTMRNIIYIIVVNSTDGCCDMHTLS